MKNESMFTERFFGYDTNGDQYQFDTWARAREWVAEQPETRSAVKESITHKTEHYTMPKCFRCQRFMAPHLLNPAGTCGPCNTKTWENL